MTALEIDTRSRNKIVDDVDGVFLVEAGAGSGKTTMLVNRMVAMVERGIDISKICAITFTIAAASEFYDRFQQKLIERSDPNLDWEDTGYAGELGKPTPETIELCAKALKDIDLCFMGTIDSFCNLVLSEHPTEAGILSDSHLLTKTDAQTVYMRLYVDICNGLYGEDLRMKANRFRACHYNDQEVFRQGMSILMEHRNVDFDFSMNETLDIEKECAAEKTKLLGLLDWLIRKEGDGIKQTTEKTSRAAWESLHDTKRTLSKNWTDNFSSVMYCVNKNFNGLRILPHAYTDPSFADYRCLFIEYRNKKDIVEYYVLTLENDPVVSGIKEKLQEAHYDNTISLLKDCITIADNITHDSGNMSYFDNLYYLRNMLKKDASDGGALIRYIRQRHSYFLIDEFQDTNPMQAEIFFYLSSDNPVREWYDCVPEKGSLFIVGDPKQSIYRFRNADVASFNNVKNLITQNGGEILYLTRNFRSKKSLSEHFNDVFVNVFPNTTADQSKYVEIPCDTGAVCDVADEFNGVFRYSINKKSEDKTSIRDIINDLVGNPQKKYWLRGKGDGDPRPVQYKDFMIITYNKDYLKEIMKEFDGAGIPYKVEGNVLFEECEALKEASRIYSVFADLNDQISLYGALLGLLGNFKPEELKVFRSENGVLSLAADVDPANYKKRSSRKVAKKLVELRETYIKAKNMSPASLLSYVIDKYKVLAYVDSDGLEILYYTLELLRSAESSGEIVTLKDGKEYLDHLIEGASDIERCLSLTKDDNKVHLANLHKVKGLEAPIVILSCSNFSPNSTVSMRIEYDKNLTQGYLFSLSNEDSKKSAYCRTDRFPLKEQEELVSSFAEDDRKLYVAATRARNALIICDTMKDSNRWGNLITMSLGSIFAGFNDGGDDSDSNPDPNPSSTNNPEIKALDQYKEAEAASVFKRRKRSEKPSYNYKKPSTLGTEQQNNSGDVDHVTRMFPKEFATLMGTMTHRLMEIIVSANNNVDVDAAIKEIITEFRTFKSEDYEDVFENLLKDVALTMRNGGYAQDNGLPQDLLKELMSAEKVYCEVPFSYKEGTGDDAVLWYGVMDVVYLKDGKWHIVDYKTNADGSDLDEHYKKQLNAYIAAFKEITGNDADAKTYHINL